MRNKGLQNAILGGKGELLGKRDETIKCLFKKEMPENHHVEHLETGEASQFIVELVVRSRLSQAPSRKIWNIAFHGSVDVVYTMEQKQDQRVSSKPVW